MNKLLLTILLAFSALTATAQTIRCVPDGNGGFRCAPDCMAGTRCNS